MQNSDMSNVSGRNSPTNSSLSFHTAIEEPETFEFIEPPPIPIINTEPKSISTQTDPKLHLDSAVNTIWPKNLQSERLLESAITRDPFLSKFRQLILEKRWDEISALGEFYNSIRKDLSVVENLIYVDQKLVIPDSLQHVILESLHIGHPGATGMRALADDIWWPGMATQIRSMAESCELCLAAGKALKTLIPSKFKKQKVIPSLVFAIRATYGS